MSEPPPSAFYASRMTRPGHGAELDALLAHEFEVSGNMPHSWCEAGLGLLAAADDLRAGLGKLTRPGRDATSEQYFEWVRNVHIFIVAQMLRGMAVEDFLKAVWIRHFFSPNRLTREGSYAKIPGTNDHDLSSIARKVLPAASLTPQREEVLRSLSRAIYGGRYPIGKRPRAKDDPYLIDDWDDDREAVFGTLLDEMLSSLPTWVKYLGGPSTDAPPAGSR